MADQPSAASEALDNATQFRVSVVSRYLKHLEDGTTDTHPDGARFIPAEEYVDPEILVKDRAMLRRFPLVVALTCQVAQPRSFHTEEILGVPVLLIRQLDGSVKAFLNSCVHRGARIAEGSGAAGSRLVCPYHAWSYKIDGTLATVNQAAKFGSFDKSCHGLNELPCTERYGLIFVTLDKTGQTDIDAFLGDFAPKLAEATLEDTEFYGQWPFPQDMNWKVALSTYFEAYHIKQTHAATIAPMFVGNLATVDSYGPNKEHHITTWAMANVEDFAGLSEGEVRQRLVKEVPFTRVLFLFPNVVITHDDLGAIPLAHVIRVTPGDNPNSQLTDFRIVCRGNPSPEARAILEDMAKLTVYALEEEDYKTVRHTSKALASGLQDGLHFGANEPALTELHRHWASAGGRDLGDRPADTK
jgi:phenylpropionate dioxygenase-like ring-hydroxylating dioxygenase large terminal subunit